MTDTPPPSHSRHRRHRSRSKQKKPVPKETPTTTTLQEWMTDVTQRLTNMEDWVMKLYEVVSRGENRQVDTPRSTHDDFLNDLGEGDSEDYTTTSSEEEEEEDDEQEEKDQHKKSSRSRNSSRSRHSDTHSRHSDTRSKRSSHIPNRKSKSRSPTPPRTPKRTPSPAFVDVSPQQLDTTLVNNVVKKSPIPTLQKTNHRPSFGIKSKYEQPPQPPQPLQPLQSYRTYRDHRYNSRSKSRSPEGSPQPSPVQPCLYVPNTTTNNIPTFFNTDTR